MAGNMSSYNDSQSTIQKQDEYTQSEEKKPPKRDEEVVIILKED